MRPRAEVVVIASSFEQARLTFDHVFNFGERGAGGGHWSRNRWRVWNTGNAARIESLVTGARLRCLGSDPRRAHGLAPSLVLADEPAQWPPTTAEAMVAALRTALGKVDGARLVALGTRAASSEHWFERMLHDADYAQCHAAERDADPTDPAAWAAANPSLDYMPALRAAIEAESASAEGDASALASFRALRLNAGVADTVESLLLDSVTWARCEEWAPPAGRYVLGIDLGGSAAMSAAACYWPDTGRLVCRACFPTLPSLAERGRLDGVGDRYERMLERRELLIAGNRVSDVPALLNDVLARYGAPTLVVADRWREAELRDALEASDIVSGYTRIETRGQGFMDGGEDVREFRRAALAGEIRAAESLVLRSAIGEARVTCDPAGNWKLAKGSQGGRRARARDDAAAAAILAVAAGCRRARRAASTAAAPSVLV